MGTAASAHATLRQDPKIGAEDAFWASRDMLRRIWGKLGHLTQTQGATEPQAGYVPAPAPVPAPVPVSVGLW